MITSTTDLLNRVRDFAAEKHRHQERRYSGEPYFTHCEDVAQILSNVEDVTVEVLCAAYLHDTLEDTDTTSVEITELFGEEVASLVEAVTDQSKPSDGNRVKRKEIDRIHISTASIDAKNIKLADMISNIRDVASRDKNFASVYLQEKKSLLEVLRGGDKNLVVLAEKALQVAFRELEQ